MTTRRILIRRDTAAAWTAANPTLASGELGGETDTGKLKLGNGSTAWNSLAYQGGVTSVNGDTGVVTGLATTASPTFTGTVTIPTGAAITLPTVASGINHSGSTSGTTKLQASAIASGTITLPAVTGTVVTTGDSGTVTSAMIADGTIVDADINASAAIAYSKLSLGTSIVNADINASAAIDTTKVTNWENDQVVLNNRIFN